MSTYSLSQLADGVLLHDLAALVARERHTTATLLAHLAEVDARKLYLPAAYPSMSEYCLGELRLTEECAFKRIRAARTARRFPAIFAALADGRLHLSAVLLLAPHLTEENAADLLESAERLSKSGIELLIAQRFPRPDLPTRSEAISPPSPTLPMDQLAPGPVEALEPRTKLAPLSPQRFALQLTIEQVTHDKLRYAQALLGVPSGNVAPVLDRALDALVRELEKTRFAATTRPRAQQRRATAPRTIPAAVKRAVWERDQGQCSFVSQTGQSCQARTHLQFDHIVPVACGGSATVAAIRLRCAGHNQFEAEREFGTDFMQHKRQEAKRWRAEARRAREARAAEEARVAEARVAAETRAAEAKAAAEARAKVTAAVEEVIPALRALGLKAGEAREAAALCESIPDWAPGARAPGRRARLTLRTEPLYCAVLVARRLNPFAERS